MSGVYPAPLSNTEILYVSQKMAEYRQYLKDLGNSEEQIRFALKKVEEGLRNNMVSAAIEFENLIYRLRR
jgi:hypothetical protein